MILSLVGTTQRVVLQTYQKIENELYKKLANVRPNMNLAVTFSHHFKLDRTLVSLYLFNQNNMKKIFRYALLLIGLLLLIGWIVTTFFPDKLVPMMLQQQLKRQIAQVEKNNQLLQDDESIYVYTVGTSAPLPGERVQTGTAVIVNGHFFMFDVGDGVVRRAENMGLPLNKLEGIFITHWHSDHFMDLSSMVSRTWLLGRTNDLHLYGPDGTDSINQSIKGYLHLENKHRVDHHGTQIMDISKARAIPHEFKNVQGGKEVSLSKRWDYNHRF